MRFSELSVVQKELLLELAKTNSVIVELRGNVNKDMSCHMENRKGEISKKVNKRTLYSLINRGLLDSVSDYYKITYTLNNKALLLLANREKENIKLKYSNEDLIRIKNVLVKNGFNVFEPKKLDIKYKAEFTKLFNLKNIGNVLVCVYKYENYSNKYFHLIIVEDKNGYHVGTKDTYNKVLEPYDKVGSIKSLESSIRVILDIIMESEMDFENDF